MEGDSQVRPAVTGRSLGDGQVHPSPQVTGLCLFMGEVASRKPGASARWCGVDACATVDIFRGRENYTGPLA